MSDAPVSLPVSPTELKIEIGKTILRASMAELQVEDAMVDMVVSRAPDAHHIEAADNWRASNPGAAQHLAFIAQHTLETCATPDDIVVSLVYDMTNAVLLLPAMQRGAFLDTIGPILRLVVEARDTSDARMCLGALAAYGRGE